jgi:hypothetical protein
LQALVEPVNLSFQPGYLLGASPEGGFPVGGGQTEVGADVEQFILDGPK